MLEKRREQLNIPKLRQELATLSSVMLDLSEKMLYKANDTQKGQIDFFLGECEDILDISSMEDRQVEGAMYKATAIYKAMQRMARDMKIYHVN